MAAGVARSLRRLWPLWEAGWWVPRCMGGRVQPVARLEPSTCVPGVGSGVVGGGVCGGRYCSFEGVVWG